MDLNGESKETNTMLLILFNELYKRGPIDRA